MKKNNMGKNKLEKKLKIENNLTSENISLFLKKFGRSLIVLDGVVNTDSSVLNDNAVDKPRK